MPRVRSLLSRPLVRRDGAALDPDELETLQHLCDAAAQAYTYIEVSRYHAERAGASA